MKNYLSRITSLFLCILFLSSTVTVTLEAEEDWYENFPKKTTVVLGVIALGVCVGGKLAYTYWCNRSESKSKQKQLDAISSRADENTFSFQGYRLSDIRSDKKFWPTADDIFKNKKVVQETLYDDIVQGDRIYISSKPCISNDETTIKLNFSNIKQALTQEIFELRRSISQLSEYTDVCNDIEQLLINANNGNDIVDDDAPNWKKRVKNYNRYENYLDRLYTTFSTFTKDELDAFTIELNKRIQEHNNKWWKKIICPYYAKLSEQYWEFVKSYVRTCALKNVVDEKYIELLQKQDYIEEELE